MNDLPKALLPVATTTTQKEPPAHHRCALHMPSMVLHVPTPECHALVVQAVVTDEGGVA